MPTSSRRRCLLTSSASSSTAQWTGPLLPGASCSTVLPGGSSPVNPQDVPGSHEALLGLLHQVRCFRPIPPFRAHTVLLCSLPCGARPHSPDREVLPVSLEEHSNFPGSSRPPQAVLPPSVEEGSGWNPEVSASTTRCTPDQAPHHSSDTFPDERYPAAITEPGQVGYLGHRLLCLFRLLPSGGTVTVFHGRFQPSDESGLG